MCGRKWMHVVFGVIVAALATTSGAGAFGSPTRTSYLTFNQPIALPGVSLAAGTYIFEIADVNARDVVRVMSRDWREVYLQSFTRVVRRPEGLGRDRLVSFGEAPSGRPQPVRVWWPQYQEIGREFVYPTNR